jgi:signal transduction histidine kinase
VQKRASIYLRLMLAALLALVAGMAAAFLIATAAFTRALEDRVGEQAQHAATVLTRSQLPLTPDLLGRVAELERTGFVLLDSTGTIVESSYPSVPRALADVIGSWRSRPPTPGSVAHLDVDGVPSIAVLAPVSSAADTRVVALVAVASLVDARAAAWRAAVGVAIAVLIAGTLMAALLRYRFRAVTQPLERLAAFAGAVAAGGRDERLPVSGHDELAQLSTAVNDMTERIGQYEARLAANTRLSALGEMAARIAHEVRNPLTGLKMQLELLGERFPEAERPTIRQLLDEVRRLELVVDASLTLARDRPVRREPVDISSLAGDVLSLLGPSFAHRNIRVDAQLAATQRVAGDPHQLKQALMNLLGNAADALPGGGRILVSTACTSDPPRVIVQVADSGPGIGEELATRLASGPASTKPFGLGLGLMLCREVATTHGGQLVMTAHGALGGAAFALELPVAASDAQSALK